MKKFLNLEFVKILLSVILLVVAILLIDNPISLFFYLASYILIAWKLLKNTYHNILEHVWFDENTLMLIATVGAFFIEEYPEAVMVVLLYNLGEALSHLALHHSRESITNLMDLTSDEVRLLIHEEEAVIPAKDTKVGDIFIVRLWRGSCSSRRPYETCGRPPSGMKFLVILLVGFCPQCTSCTNGHSNLGGFSLFHF